MTGSRSRASIDVPASPQVDPFEAAHAAALAALPGIGPASLAEVIAGRRPSEAWEKVRAGHIERPAPRKGRPVPGGSNPGSGQAPLFDQSPGPAGTASGPGSRRSWADFARRLEPVPWWEPWKAAGVRVTWREGPIYPSSLIEDPEPPGVLFWRGSLECLQSLCVAIVGTRNATPDGRAIAFELARDLVEAGVCVVSGLALGIDGAAHAGALASVRSGAPGCTVGVAASGVDVPYPRRHTSLWQEVAQTGAILSETPPGRPAQAWRFPSRNRVIAGLAQMVVVVESHMCGGSLITAEAAIERGVEVRVVPGPVHSPASAGSNQLLYDGPGPVRDARDVLDALGVVRPDRPRKRTATDPPMRQGQGPGPVQRRGMRPQSVDPWSDPDRSEQARQSPGSPCAPGSAPRPPVDPGARQVLDAMGWRPASTGQIMERTGLPPAAVLAALDTLVAAGHASAERGWWVRKK